MALVNQTLKLEITPWGVPPILHVTEYDENMQVTVQLLRRGQDFSPPSGTTAQVEGTIAGHPFSEDGTPSGNTVKRISFESGGRVFRNPFRSSPFANAA